jgi:hypothetical protein
MAAYRGGRLLSISRPWLGPRKLSFPDLKENRRETMRPLATLQPTEEACWDIKTFDVEFTEMYRGIEIQEFRSLCSLLILLSCRIFYSPIATDVACLLFQYSGRSPLELQTGDERLHRRFKNLPHRGRKFTALTCRSRTVSRNRIFSSSFLNSILAPVIHFFPSLPLLPSCLKF